MGWRTGREATGEARRWATGAAVTRGPDGGYDSKVGWECGWPPRWGWGPVVWFGLLWDRVKVCPCIVGGM